MKVWGQLERASVENVGALPTAGIKGRVVFLTTDSRFYYDDGSNFVKVVSPATTDTLTNKTFDADGTGNSITNIENADIKVGAAIARSKLATGSASHVVINDGSGAFSSEAQLDKTRGGTGVSSTATFPTSGVVVTEAGTSTLTNKTFDADGTGNSITNIENADIKAAAAIALNKLAATTASRALVSDGSGFVSAATTTATEIGYVNGVTSAIQTQLDAKIAKSLLTTKGDIIVATGSATPVRQAIGSDNQVLVADSSVTNGLKWTTLQQGAKNYVTYNNFENNATTGWSLSHTTLSSNVPNQASGSWTSASGSLAISSVSSGKLAGSYSLQQAWTGTTSVPGDMLVSQAYTIDLEDQAKVMQFSFYYSATVGGSLLNFSGTSSNTYQVYIYDVVNSAWIQPQGVYNMVQGSGVGFCTGTFQTPSNMTDFRIAVVCINASSSGSHTLLFDDFYLGPQKVVYGAPVEDWKSATVTSSLTTNATTTAKKRRIGDSVTYRVETSFTNTNTQGAYTVTLDHTIDTDKIISLSGGASTLGFATYFDSAGGTGSGRLLGQVRYNSSTSVDVTFMEDGAASDHYQVVTNSNTNTPLTVGSGDKIILEFTVPVLGFSSNTVMSSDTDTRVVAFKARGSSTTIAASSTETDVVNPFIVYDTHGGYNTSTGVYTIPVSGKYRFSAGVQGASLSYTATANLYLALGKNAASGAPVIDVDVVEATNTKRMYLFGTTTLDLVAGDAIRLICSQNNAATSALTSSTTYNYFEGERISGPATIAASETVEASAYRATSDQTITAASTDETVAFNTVRTDTHGTMATTGIYTVPVAGKYMVSYGLRSVMGATAASTIYAGVFKNNAAPYYALWLSDSLANSKTYTVTGTTIVTCVAGDTLRVICDCATQNITLSSSGSGNETTYVHIMRIGN